MLIRRTPVLLFAVALCLAQTRVDYPTQVKNAPIFSDAGPAGSTLQSLCARAGDGTLSITKRWVAQATQTVTCKLSFAGGVIQPAAGQTVQISPNTACALSQQCFDTSLGGHIGFAVLPAVISPVWWGADPTNTICSEAALNEAVYVVKTFGIAGYGSKIGVPPGTFKMCGVWTINNLRGIVVEGTANMTRLTPAWAGASSGPQILWQGNSYSVLRNFYIQGNPSFPLLAGVEVNQSTSTSQANLFQWLDIESTSITDAMLFDAPVNFGNNDFQTIEHCHIYGSHSGLALTGGEQNYSYHISDSFIGDRTRSTYGIYDVATNPGMAPGAASFVLERGSVASTTFDFFINGRSDSAIEISDVNNETAGGLISVSDWVRVIYKRGRWVNTSAGGPLTMINIGNGSEVILEDAQLTTSPRRQGIISYAGNNVGFQFPNLVFRNSFISSTSFTYAQLFNTGSYTNNFNDYGLQWSDGATAQTYFFEPNTYSTGTITVSGTGVTGAGTSWNTAWPSSGASTTFIQWATGGVTYTCPIASITNATTMTLGFSCGVGATNVAYTIGYGASSNNLRDLNVRGAFQNASNVDNPVALPVNSVVNPTANIDVSAGDFFTTANTAQTTYTSVSNCVAGKKFVVAFRDFNAALTPSSSFSGFSNVASFQFPLPGGSTAYGKYTEAAHFICLSTSGPATWVDPPIIPSADVAISNGNQATTTGLSTTKTVRDAAGTGTCTLIYTDGQLTGGTC